MHPPPPLKPARTPLMQQWIDALRSGKYTQVTGRLIDQVAYDTPPSFCCLGVLCDVAGLQRAPKREGAYFLTSTGMAYYSNPPSEVIEAAVGDVGPYFTDDLIARAVRMNDQQGKSFAQIADYLEERF